ncbi:hypothetical protein F5Y07DRAFT_393679 [Xylaria sp. FL0933]|nr:hypothetical protein F5Y07DRAFT_393679 [Xylaria sp. FL0933]
MQLRDCLHTLGATLLFLVSTTLGQDSPWQVTDLKSWSPSGRPGTNPDWYIHVNITSTDSPSSMVYCQIVWDYPDVPYNQTLDCEVLDASDSTAWTVELLEATDDDPYPTTNFDLRWRAATPLIYSTDEDFQILTGVGQFEVGKNMQGLANATQVAESDGNITEIRRLGGELDAYSAFSPATPATAELLISLYHREGLKSRVQEAHYRAAVEWIGVREIEKTSEHAVLCIKYDRLFKGLERPSIKKMEQLLEMPTSHPH